MTNPARSVPLLVEKAMQLAETQRFDRSCSPEVGRLLAVLAAQYSSGTVAEIGTGCGVGAAWMVGALRPGVHFLSVDLDAERAADAAQLFAGYPNVRVLAGDWREILPHAPFSLLFADAAAAKQADPGELIAALAPGGLLLLDNLTPLDRWPEEWRGKPDPVRDAWLHDGRVNAVELRVSPDEAVILASRR